MSLVRTTAALTGVAGLLALAACTSSGGTSGTASSSAAGGGPIAVQATDSQCGVAAATAPAGTITFQVQNTGSKVTEFYVYGAGDRIVGEVENITPGLSRELKVEITEPGTFTTACKPGMVGDGIRAAFTVTGTAQPGSADQKVAKAITDYQAYVAEQSAELLTGTEAFVAAVKAGDVAKAKALYTPARVPWERIEPVAESFGDLDPKIDGREDVVEEGLPFTGYHRLEKDLWVDGLKPDSSAIADQLLVDVKTIVDKAKGVDFTALSIANGAKELLDEVATTKITGEEERYSHTDLADMKANLQGSQSALEVLRPVIAERQADLATALDAAFTTINQALDQYQKGMDYAPLTDLTADQVKDLTVKLDALSEQVAKVPGVVESGAGGTPTS
ncbi:MAG TPA: iron uptake system protein EfeO [Lapillicoccus sp.]|jgi:iron uptake system component EfeO|nr:iron uptake system protein EfeO [Lapillicoccus sp.]